MSARSESERSCVSTEEDPMRPEGRGEDYLRMKPPLQLQQQESQQQSQQNQSQQKQSQQPLPQPKTKIEPLIQPIYVRGDAADDEDEEDDDDGEQDDEDDEEDGEEFMEADGNQKSAGVEKFMLGRDGRSKEGVDRGEKRAVTNARVRIQGRDDKRVQEDCRYIDGYDGEGVDGDEYDEVEGKRCAESFSSSAKSHTIMSSTPASMQNTKPPLRAPSASSRIRPIRNMATNSNGANQGTKKKKKKKRVKRIIGVNLTACKYQSVRRSIAAMGWKEVGEDEDWVLYWTDTSVSTERVMNLKRYQKINHFPGMIEISRKAHMARNLRRMEKFFPEEYNITPKTWILPQELGEFKKVLLKKKKRTYIIKPDAGSQGKGIYLVRRPEDLVIPESGNFMNAVAQEYLAKPLLIDGYKFDMRIYALVMSCDPLRIFLYKEGMGRFCTNPYQEPTLENLENVFMHLTNYSINKNNDKFIYTNDPESFGEGSKRTLSAMKSILEERGISWSQLWEKIGDIIIKTLICIQPMLAHVYRTCVPDGMEGSACFELLGFDIIIDSQLKPLLLEVNHSPSLSCDSGIDTYIKDNLLKSVCNLLHIDSNYMKRYQKEQKLRFQQRIFGNRKKSDEMDGIDKEDTKSKYLEIQAKWEEEHMGNFTRIYPSENSEKYDPFFSVAWSGGIGETQSNMAKKMQAQKKVEEQVKLSKPQTKISDKDRRGSERKLSERPLSARSSRLTESRTSKSREINDGLSSEKVSREIMNAQDFDEMKKLTSEIGRHKSPAPSRQSISYLVLGDNLPHSEIPGHEKVDVLGLTDAQLSDLCLNLPEDRQLQPEIQKRTRFLKGIGIREKIGQLIASMQEAQRNSKKFINITKHITNKEEFMVSKEQQGISKDFNEENHSDGEEIEVFHSRKHFESSRGNSHMLDSSSKVSVLVPPHLRKQLMCDPDRDAAAQPSKGFQSFNPGNIKRLIDSARQSSSHSASQFRVSVDYINPEYPSSSKSVYPAPVLVNPSSDHGISAATSNSVRPISSGGISTNAQDPVRSDGPSSFRSQFHRTRSSPQINHFAPKPPSRGISTGPERPTTGLKPNGLHAPGILTQRKDERSPAPPGIIRGRF